jgi:hypothetical protein
MELMGADVGEARRPWIWGVAYVEAKALRAEVRFATVTLHWYPNPTPGRVVQAILVWATTTSQREASSAKVAPVEPPEYVAVTAAAPTGPKSWPMRTTTVPASEAKGCTYSGLEGQGPRGWSEGGGGVERQRWRRVCGIDGPLTHNLATKET